MRQYSSLNSIIRLLYPCPRVDIQPTHPDAVDREKKERQGKKERENTELYRLLIAQDSIPSVAACFACSSLRNGGGQPRKVESEIHSVLYNQHQSTSAAAIG